MRRGGSTAKSLVDITAIDVDDIVPDDMDDMDLCCDGREAKAIVDGSTDDTQKAHMALRFRLFLIDMLKEFISIFVFLQKNFYNFCILQFYETSWNEFLKVTRNIIVTDWI